MRLDILTDLTGRGIGQLLCCRLLLGTSESTCGPKVHILHPGMLLLSYRS